MRYNKGILIIFIIFVVFVNCSEDIGINDFKYQCKTDNDCQSGYVCDKTRGCVRAGKDAGIDGGEDIFADVSDILDIGDVLDIGDIEDVLDIQDAGEIEDRGILEDVIADGIISDVSEDIEEITDITDVEDGGITTDDGGIDTGVVYILRQESVYDSNAGVCTSPNYILESVTGFTSREEMRSSNYILRGNILFSK